MGTNLKGWCLTGQHDQCPVEQYDRRCGCECHENS